MNVLVLGGDERSRFLHIQFNKAGHRTHYYSDAELGLGDIKTGQIDMAVLPIPTKLGQGGSLLPFKHIDLTEILRVIPEDARIIYGSWNEIVKTQMEQRLATNLLDDEPFTMANAYLTAEAALGILLANGTSMVKGSRCLIAGFGRIGAALFKLLMDIEAKVTVATGHKGSAKIIRALGGEAIGYDAIPESLESFDFVLNTAPSPIFALDDLRCYGGLYYELASPPYGFEAETLDDKDCNIIMCPALPGKCYPKDAADVIYRSIFGCNQ